MTVTNIYPLENLGGIETTYRMYEVKGIPKEIDHYYSITQKLCNELTKTSESPCIPIERKDRFLVAQLEGGKELPTDFPAIGAQAVIAPVGEPKLLSFDSLEPTEVPLALRYLQSAAQKVFQRNPSFWQPRPGATVFHKIPDQGFQQSSSYVDLYRGFIFRFIELPGRRFGLCLDVTRKYVGRKPLPATIARDDFRKYKRRHVVYEYGGTWYEVRIEGLSDLNVSEVKMPDRTTLYDHLKDLNWGERESFFGSVPKDGSVLIYHTTSGALRNLPAALCRPVLKSSSPMVRDLHWQTMLDPDSRRREIEYVVKEYFGDFTIGGRAVDLSTPLSFEHSRIPLPKLLFGNGKTIQPSEYGDGGNTPFFEWGAAKKRTLLSTDAGPFKKSGLFQQYLVLPKTFQESFSSLFLQDLREQFKTVYSPSGEFDYSPSVVFYDDSVGSSVPVLGREIVNVLTQNAFYSGYGLIVIPRLRQSDENTEDELANLLMRELRSHEIYVSIIHTEQAQRAYVYSSASKKWTLTSDRRRASKFRSYLQNVVINKILLLNSQWPFVLGDALNADLTIGLDVKNNTAGFTFVMKDGRTIWTSMSDSMHKERLSQGQCSSMIYRELKEHQPSGNLPRSIVLHRDGRSFDEEIRGIKDGLGRLASESLVARDFDLTVVEIHKSSMAHVRFFEPLAPPGAQVEGTTNPNVGTNLVLMDSAYLTTTGLPYTFQGTAKPINITRVEGTMPFDDVLDDVFRLSNLTWTRIDDCSRVPITIKMTDIRLREVAGDYNRDAFEFGSTEEES